MAAAEEPSLLPLDPRVRVLWWLGGLAAGVPVLVLGTLVALVAPVPDRVPDTALLTAVWVAGLAGVGVVPVVRYRRWQYALRDDDLWIRRGVVWVRTSVIPYRRLQFVDLQQGPLERALGLAHLVVHTAAPGTSGELVGLAAADAERLREQLVRVADDRDGL